MRFRLPAGKQIRQPEKRFTDATKEIELKLQNWNESALISALAAVLSWIYPPFICFIGAGGVCAVAFGAIALLELRETPARGRSLARLGWYMGWVNIAVYVYLMASLVRQALQGG